MIPWPFPHQVPPRTACTLLESLFRSEPCPLLGSLTFFILFFCPPCVDTLRFPRNIPNGASEPSSYHLPTSLFPILNSCEPGRFFLPSGGLLRAILRRPWGQSAESLFIRFAALIGTRFFFIFYEFPSVERPPCWFSPRPSPLSSVSPPTKIVNIS